MKIFLFLLLKVLLCLNAFSQLDSAGCLKFRKGLFAYTDDSSQHFLVKRTGNVQEEIQQGTNIKTRFRIKWVGSCSYELKQLWSNSKVKRKNNGAVTTVLITRADKDQYTFTCNCKDLPDHKRTSGIVYLLPGKP